MSASTITRAYFRKLRELLTDDGVALVHTIGRSEPPDRHQSLHRQIHLPRRLHPRAVGDGAAIERSGLIITDIEVLRLHYAETLRAWRQRFLANWDKAAAIQDETLLPDVGVLSRRLRDGLPLPEPGRVPAPAHQAHHRRCRSPATTCTRPSA